MSGHSRWSQIKHKKASSDAQKSRYFGKLAREISLAAGLFGPNPETNHKLKSAIENARNFNVPSANIERAIKRATGENKERLEEVMFEAYGPGGSALIITGITDNKNRTTQEVKHLLSEHGVKLARPNSALFLFTKTSNGWQARENMKVGKEHKASLEKLFEALDEIDDINDIYTNAQL